MAREFIRKERIFTIKLLKSAETAETAVAEAVPMCVSAVVKKPLYIDISLISSFLHNFMHYSAG